MERVMKLCNMKKNWKDWDHMLLRTLNGSNKTIAETICPKCLMANKREYFSKVFRAFRKMCPEYYNGNRKKSSWMLEHNSLKTF